MKLNLDCIHDILIAISEAIIPDEYGYVEPIDPLEISKVTLTNYSQNESMYWIRQLMDAQIIISGPKYVDKPLPLIEDLSFSGYQFINTAGSPSIWNKIKPSLLAVSINSVTALIQKAIEIGASCIT